MEKIDDIERSVLVLDRAELILIQRGLTLVRQQIDAEKYGYMMDNDTGVLPEELQQRFRIEGAYVDSMLSEFEP